MNLYRKCIQSLLIQSCGNSWWELYKVRFVRGTVFVVIITSHPNVVQFRFRIILPASNYASLNWACTCTVIIATGQSVAGVDLGQILAMLKIDWILTP